MKHECNESDHEVKLLYLSYTSRVHHETSSSGYKHSTLRMDFSTRKMATWFHLPVDV